VQATASEVWNGHREGKHGTEDHDSNEGDGMHQLMIERMRWSWTGGRRGRSEDDEQQRRTQLVIDQ